MSPDDLEAVVALPTVTDLKTHINIPVDNTTDDDEMQDVLDAAIEIVEGIVGPLSVGEVTETHYGINSGVLILRQAPVTELTAVSTRYAGVDTPVDSLADYELDPATGLVRGWFYGTYVVTYSTGHASLPASLRLAVLIIAAHLWQTQRVPGVNRFGSPDEPAVSVGFAIPNRAAELLAPYRTSVGLA